MYERAVKDNQLLVKKYNEKELEVKKLKREVKRPDAARMSRRSVSREQVSFLPLCWLLQFQHTNFFLCSVCLWQ